MLSNLYGNPHAASPSSQHSSSRIDDCRLAALRLFNASPAHFDIIFVANATAGIKLVMEAFRSQDGGFKYLYHGDSHTSLVGVRESAADGHICFRSDDEVEQWLQSRDGRVLGFDAPGKRDKMACSLSAIENSSSPSSCSSSECGGSEDQSTKPSSSACSCAKASGCQWRGDESGPLELFAYPAQSNMDGRRLPFSWPSRLQGKGAQDQKTCFSLLDAAALVSTYPLDLHDPSCSPDFTVISFYKMFGFPDLGGLIVKKEVSHLFNQRQYFGGGTVDMVTCFEEQWHAPKSTSLHDRLEDGTLPFHSITALGHAIDVHRELFGSFVNISKHTTRLTNRLRNRLGNLRHNNGMRLCELYGNPIDGSSEAAKKGPVVAFNMRDSTGAWLSNSEVEKLASIHHIHIRSGGLCNPGGMATSLKLAPWELKENFSAGFRCGSENDVVDGKPTGMLRVSVGAMSVDHDVEIFLHFIEEFFVDKSPANSPQNLYGSKSLPQSNELIVEQLTVYPIKSCAGWNIPHNKDWAIHHEGLAWDREWCLVHAGTGIALSQKKYPKMALIQPRLDFELGLLHIRYAGSLPKTHASREIAVPLSQDPKYFSEDRSAEQASQVCGDAISARPYSPAWITLFFSSVLGVPCLLARFPKSNDVELSIRHAKPFLQSSISSSLPNQREEDGKPIELPSLLFSNESPILVVNRSSIEKLDEEIRLGESSSMRSREAVDPGDATLETNAANFRANIILGSSSVASKPIKPYAEDAWTSLQIGVHCLQILGPCRRCQMVCVDQRTAERTRQPFSTLVKTRRRGGKVWFGVHTCLEKPKELDRFGASKTVSCPKVRAGQGVTAFTALQSEENSPC